MGDMRMATSGTRRPDKALTAQFVRNVKTSGKYFDGNGLFLRVQANGNAQWVQRIVVRGKRCELGLGSSPLVPLLEARETALANRRIARAGGDPLDAKRRAEAVLTFAEAARKVHEMHLPSWRNEKHAAQFIATLETYTFPLLGDLKVAEISTADVLNVLQPIWLTKQETARRVRQRIGTVMKWAIAKGWRKDNPAENVGKALPKHDGVKVHRKALPYAEVSGCIAKVKASGAGQSTKLAIEFLILTASRSGEVRGALWQEIDFHGATNATRATRATWEIPASRMKMKRAHRIPLPKQAIEILRKAEALSDETGLIFPSVRKKQLSDMTLTKLVKELGFDADIHGFRTSFRTWAQEQTNFPREVAEAALAHVVKDKSEAAYARSDVFERRAKMMDAWASYLLSTRGEVVKLGAKL